MVYQLRIGVSIDRKKGYAVKEIVAITKKFGLKKKFWDSLLDEGSVYVAKDITIQVFKEYAKDVEERNQRPYNTHLYLGTDDMKKWYPLMNALQDLLNQYKKEGAKVSNDIIH